MELTISIIGASVAILVSLIGAWLTNRNVITLQTRKLKEQYYFDFVTALHNHISDNLNESFLGDFIKARDIMITIASADVVNKLIDLETKGFRIEGKPFSQETHNFYLTELIKAIRKDLKMCNKNFPTISFKKRLNQ
jgi:hypothetical protein